MIDTNINYLAVLVSGAASMAIGFLWYSNALFGKQWMAEMKFSQEKMEEMKAKKSGMGKTYTLTFISTLVTAYALAVMVDRFVAQNISDGLQIGFLAWLGFVATIKLTDLLFGGKSKTLFLIDVGHNLASFLTMSVILTLWK